jgi:hypothetical protein
MQIISIVTGLAPRIDGVGDYALSLARLFRTELSVDTHFIVGDPGWNGSESVEGFGVTKLQGRSQARLLNALNAKAQSAATVLLHYSGYSYATRGCPVWLIDGLEQWRKQSGERRLVTVFHELYAKGPVWTSAFWLSPLQKHLAARLARLSDHYVTSSNHYAEMICRWGNGGHAEPRSLPIFSNIGEPREVLPLSERSRRLVVFGTRGRRVEIYRRSASELNHICQRLGIEEIIDIGRPVGLDISRVVHVPVRTCGELPNREVSELLSGAVAGMIDYPPIILSKSGIFAAYCAHRMIPIVAAYGDAKPADGLEPRKHYWLSDTGSEKLSLAVGQTVADKAFRWYQAHNRSAHVKSFAACLAVNGNDRNGSRILVQTEKYSD